MKKAARIAIIIVILALIRCLSECFRFEYLMGDKLTIVTLRPFIMGGLICAISCLGMSVSLFYSRYKLTVIVATLTIIALVIVKIKYMA